MLEQLWCHVRLPASYANRFTALVLLRHRLTGVEPASQASTDDAALRREDLLEFEVEGLESLQKMESSHSECR